MGQTAWSVAVAFDWLNVLRADAMLQDAMNPFHLSGLILALVAFSCGVWLAWLVKVFRDSGDVTVLPTLALAVSAMCVLAIHTIVGTSEAPYSRWVIPDVTSFNMFGMIKIPGLSNGFLILNVVCLALIAWGFQRLKAERALVEKE